MPIAPRPNSTGLPSSPVTNSKCSNRFGGWSSVGLAASSKEDSPDSTPPARPLRSMQTGQNSIAPENSLPQLGQVHWDSVFMDLIVIPRRLKLRKEQWNSLSTCSGRVWESGACLWAADGLSRMACSGIFSRRSERHTGALVSAFDRRHLLEPLYSVSFSH